MNKIKGLKILEKKVREIIHEYIDLFGIDEPYYIMVDPKYSEGLKGYGQALCDNVDCGIIINTTDYYYDEISLKSIVLHELVHCKMLMEGTADDNDGNIHNDAFNKEAKRIEEATGIKNITWPSDGSIKFNVYSKDKKFPYVHLYNLSTDTHYVVRFSSRKDIARCKRIISEYYDYLTVSDSGCTDKLIFEDFDISDTNHEMYLLELPKEHFKLCFG